MPRIKPGTAGCDARTLSIVLCGPLPRYLHSKIFAVPMNVTKMVQMKGDKDKSKKRSSFFGQKSLGQRFLCLGFHFLFIFEKKSFFFVATLKFFLNKHIPLERRLPSGRNARWGRSNNPLWAYKTCLTCKTCTSIEIDFLTLLCCDSDGSWPEIKHFSSIV